MGEASQSLNIRLFTHFTLPLLFATCSL